MGTSGEPDSTGWTLTILKTHVSLEASGCPPTYGRIFDFNRVG
ncbi:MAG TPA: hypothetical protein VFV92_13775 [Candidatus Bathyarchaeia archaeon]|nr:hypothetical protein [Candidatus Bathyarchaeia archaeon]